MDENGAFYLPTPPPSWRERLRRSLFPAEFCPLPEDERLAKGKGDVLFTNVTVVCGLRGRLQFLLSGRMEIAARTVTEHELGFNKTAAVSFVDSPRWL